MPQEPTGTACIRPGTPNRESQNEAGWEHTFDAVPQAVFVLDGENRIQRANHAALETVECDLSQALGRHCYEVIHGTTEPPAYCPHQALLRNCRGGRGELAEPRLGKIFDMTCSPVRDQQGSLLGSVHVLSDITERRRAEDQLKLQVDHLEALRAIDMAINSSLDIRVTLGVFLDQATTRLAVDAADIFLLSRQSQMLEYAVERGFRGNARGRSHLHLGDDPVGVAVLDRHLVVIPDLEPVLDKFLRRDIIEKEGFISYVASPLIAKGHVNGVLEIWSRKRIEPDSEWLGFLETLTGQGAIAIDNSVVYADLQSSNSELLLAYDRTLEGWIKALDMRDNETEGHTRRVTELSVRLAYDYPVDKDQVVHIRRGAMLHDIGKMAIPDAILHKPGPLTPDEREIMNRHPIYAYEWLSPIPYLRSALDIPYCHHEKWDGSGYPRGLRGESIPLAARLFAVVDVWDALRSDRPYRPGWSKEKVAAHIRGEAGQHFDPHVVEVFMKYVKEYS